MEVGAIEQSGTLAQTVQSWIGKVFGEEHRLAGCGPAAIVSQLSHCCNDQGASYHSGEPLLASGGGGREHMDTSAGLSKHQDA